MKWQILVLEASDKLRGFFRTFLTFNGYDVIEAENGPDAVSLCRSHKYVDVILANHDLPGQNGLDAVMDIFELYKERLGGPPKVIIYTDLQYDSEGVSIESRVEELRIDAFFRKESLSYNALLSRIDELLPELSGISCSDYGV